MEHRRQQGALIHGAAAVQRLGSGPMSGRVPKFAHSLRDTLE